MKAMRRGLVCMELIALGGLGMVRIDAQVAVASHARGRAAWAASDRSTDPAQSSAYIADSLVDLDLRSVSLKDVLRAIAMQSHVMLLYNDDDLPKSRPLSIRLSHASASQALAIALRGTGLRTRATEAGIVIERLADSAPREIPMQQGSISGRVTDARTGQGIRGATIAIEGTHFRATSTDGGSYRIIGVPPGSYKISAKRLGYESWSQRITVDDGSDVRVDIPLEGVSTVLDQVVVTGTVIPTEIKAVPTPISVITGDQISRRQQSTLAAIVRQAVPTAIAFDAPNIPANTAISVRGTTSLNGSGAMKIFIDGVEATGFDLSAVDPASIARIEVIRGPQAATIYGANAAAGVIQIFTKRGDSSLARPQLDGRVSLGLAQTPYDGFENVLRQKYSGSLRGGGPGLSYAFGGGYSHLADYAPENGANRQSAAGMNAGLHFDRGIVAGDLSARYYRNSVPLSFNPAVVSTGFAPVSRPWYTDGIIANETYAATVVVTPVGWWRNQFTVGIDRRTLDDRQEQPRFTTPADSLLLMVNDVSRKLSVAYDGSATWALSSNLSGSLTLGVDHYTQQVSNITTSGAQNNRGTIRTAPTGGFNVALNSITNTGYFGQAQVDVGDALFLTAGLRIEDNSTFGTDYGTAALPRVGVSMVRQFGPATAKFRASFGKALRTPSAGQASGQVLATGIQLANPRLAPERQEGWDGGVDLILGRRGSLSVTLYDQTASDLIAYLQVAADPVPTFQNQNIGRVSNRGLEVVGAVGITDWLELRAQYGYVRSRIEAVDTVATGGVLKIGDKPMRVPEHSAGAELSVTPREGTTMTAGLTYVGSYRQVDALWQYRCLAVLTPDSCPASFLATFSTRAFIIDYPGFAKVNATISQRLTSSLETFVSVDNLMNSTAYEGTNTAPVIGRTTMVGIHFTY